MPTRCPDPTPSSSTTANASRPTHGARRLWITVAALFFALAALVLGLWIRTHASPGTGLDPLHRHVAETDPAASSVPRAESNLPAATACSSEADIIYRGTSSGRKEIALTFDDGPHPRYTPLILDILAEYDVHATFFMVGENVGYYPAAAEAVIAAGHEIGNHTFTHRGFSRMSEGEMRREIIACEDAIASLSETRPRFMRPPEGEMNPTMRRLIGEMDYRIVLWDVDTRDWAHTPPDVICDRVVSTVRPGDIILMHDFIGHDSPTPEALRRLIPTLQAAGYHFVTVGELVRGCEVP